MTDQIQKLIDYTREMRGYQKQYFKLHAMAKKDPRLHPERKHVLAKSKRFEIDVDQMLSQLSHPEERGTLPEVSREDPSKVGMTVNEKEVQNG